MKLHYPKTNGITPALLFFLLISNSQLNAQCTAQNNELFCCDYAPGLNVQTFNANCTGYLESFSFFTSHSSTITDLSFRVYQVDTTFTLLHEGYIEVLEPELGALWGELNRIRFEPTTEILLLENQEYAFEFYSDTVGLTMSVDYEDGSAYYNSILLTTDYTFEMEMIDLASIDKPALSTLEIYPNPFNDRIVLNFTESTPYEIRITNNLGQIIHSEKVTNSLMHEIELDVQPGVYFVNICQDGECLTRKITKM